MASESAAGRAPGGFSLWNRELTAYPERAARRLYLLLVVVITITLYYELYVGGGVATIMLSALKIPFWLFVYVLAAANLVGAFASLLAGLADRFGRANLVIYGQLLVALITLFWMPHVTGVVGWGIAVTAVSFVEGVVLVATPALIRDFSPQVGRGTAMGFWTVGPVLGSLTVSAIVTLTLPRYLTWQSQFVICGIVGVVVFLFAVVFLRELTPNLRDQLMVSERDRVLVEMKAKGLDIAASLHHPWRQMLHVDVIASALGVSMLLFFYYTMVAFGIIYVVTVFHYSLEDANALFNWSWATDAIVLVLIGMLSDRLKVRKPFMLIGGIGTVIMTALYLAQAGQTPSFGTLAAIACGQIAFTAMAYVAWMASFTETVEARNPALTATGLAVWGWIIRVVVTVCFALLPSVVTSVNPLIGAPAVLAAYQKTVADKVQPPADLLAALDGIKRAAAAAPGEWQTWFWICVGGAAFFVATIFLMRGRWSLAAAVADERAHDAAVARELEALNRA